MRLDHTAHRYILPAFLLVLQACGGGGGGDGGGGGTTPPPSGAPARPTFAYTGLTTPRVYTSDSATAAAATVMQALDESLFVLRSLPASGGPSGAVNATLPGAVSGQVVLRGQFNSSGVGWQSEDYQGYSADGNAVLDGRVVVEISSAATLGVQSIVSYHGLQVRFAKYRIQITGTVSGTRTDVVPGTSTVQMDLLFGEPSGSAVWFDRVIATVRRETHDRYAGTLSGRLYQSSDGYLDWSTPSELVLDASGPYAGGPSTAVGAGPALTLSPLNRQWMAVAMDVDGDGVQDRSHPLSWDGALSRNLLDQIETGDVVASVSGPTNGIPAGTLGGRINADITLDGLASSSPAGRPLTHAWRVLISPPGSTPTLGSPTAPVTTFRADVPGEYGVALTVDDGTRRSTELAVVRMSGSSVTDAGGRLAFGSLRTRPITALGATITVPWLGVRDSNAAHHTRTVSLIRKPATSTLSIFSNEHQQQIRFAPDVTGVYILEATHAGASDRLAVGVGPMLVAAGGVTLPGLQTTVMDDLDGDGLGDLVMLTQPSIFQEFRQTAPGRFASGVTLPAEMQNMLARADVDGDGDQDILGTTGPGANLVWWRRTGVGQYTLAQTIPRVSTAFCSSAERPRVVRASDGRVQLFTIRICGQNGIDIHEFVGGAFTPLARVEFATGPVQSLEIGDVDGNGRTDFLYSTGNELGAVLQAVDGSFGTPIPLFTPSGSAPAMLVGNYTAADRASFGHFLVDPSGDLLLRLHTWSSGSFRASDTAIPGGVCNLTLDVAGDGVDELLLCDSRQVLSFDANGVVSSSMPLFMENADAPAYSIGAAGDLDGDGTIDFASADGRLRLGRRYEP